MLGRGHFAMSFAVLSLVSPLLVAATPVQAVGTNATLNSPPDTVQSPQVRQTSRPAFEVVPPVHPVNKETAPHSEPRVRGFDPRYSQIVDKYTTPTSAFYTDADGGGALILSPAPVRFKGADGSWHTIDMSLISDLDARCGRGQRQKHYDCVPTRAIPNWTFQPPRA